jgi:hypothetical protein
MTVKLRTFAADQIDQLEAKLNDILSKPESAGYSLAAAFPSADGTNIVLIFQKP